MVRVSTVFKQCGILRAPCGSCGARAIIELVPSCGEGAEEGPSFLAKEALCLDRPWNWTCPMFEVSRTTWACNLVLGSPTVSLLAGGGGKASLLLQAVV